MSIEAMNAVGATFPTIKARLGEIDPSERPALDAITSVSQHLANKHRVSRGWVNESVDQIALALCMTPRKVKRVLSALDRFGLWTIEGKGNQHGPTKRRAAFLDMPITELADEGASSVLRNEQIEEQVPVSTEQVPLTAEHVPVPVGASSGNRATPPVPRVQPPLTQGKIACVQSAAELARLVRAIISEELPTQPVDERNSAAERAAATWMQSLSRTADPRAAFLDIEPTLRWAVHHEWWGQKAITVTACAQFWPQITAQYQTSQRPTVPKLSKAQTQNLEAVNRVISRRPPIGEIA